MSALSQTPSNINFLNPLNFLFQLKRAPNVNFFIQKAGIPSISLAQINLPTVFMPIPASGKIEYGTFPITFKVDEDLQNYLEIFLWMEHLGFPKDFQQYADIASQDLITGNGVTSDMTLLILNAIQQPNYEITMKDGFPISLVMNEFDTTNPDVNYVTATATFKYLRMIVTKYDT